MGPGLLGSETLWTTKCADLFGPVAQKNNVNNKKPREIGASLFLLFGSFQFLFQQLAFVEVGVFTVLEQEFIVSAAFDDAAFGQYTYEVGIADG